MPNECDDAAITEMLRRVVPASTNAAWREGAIAAIQSAQRTQRRPIASVTAIAAGVAVAMIGLGFVPIPMGKAPGALARAMAMASQATTVHIVGRAWVSGQESSTETWASDDGFYRSDTTSPRDLHEVYLRRGPMVLMYWVEDGQQYAGGGFDPCLLQSDAAGLPAATKSYIQVFCESFKAMQEQLGLPSPDVRITERRERSLWGGERDIVQADLITKGESNISGVHYDEGSRIRIGAEIDPTTSRILHMTQEAFEGTWERRYEADYEWDVEIPSHVREFTPPSGTKLVRHLWWQQRAGQTLAEGQTADWDVVLHAVDVGRSGNVVLSLERRLKADSALSRNMNSGVPLRVEGVGSNGKGYAQRRVFSCFNDSVVGYWTTTLTPGNPNAHPRTITLTVWPYPKGASEDQSITFNNIPLPSRQNAEDPHAAATEVIQY